MQAKTLCKSSQNYRDGFRFSVDFYKVCLGSLRILKFNHQTFLVTEDSNRQIGLAEIFCEM